MPNLLPEEIVWIIVSILDGGPGAGDGVVVVALQDGLAAEDEYPEGQAVQEPGLPSMALKTGWYVPAVHAVHVPLPAIPQLALTKLPGLHRRWAHTVQVDAPAEDE